jgi:uncharacterized membrane protein
VSTNKKKNQQRAKAQAAARQKNRQAAQSASVGSQSVREQKKAQFTDAKRNRTPLYGIAAVVAVVALIVGVSAFAHGGKKQQFAQAPVAAGGDVSIPVSQVNDGTAHFYSADVGGTTVKYFVMKAPDGTLRTAFDACDVCFPYKKGYHQQGAAMQCNNCGRVFPAAQIDVQRGGCNPGPIDAKVAGGKLVIPFSQLQAGTRLFL